MSKKSSSKGSKVLNLSAISFVAVMLIGLSLLTSFILGKVSEDFVKPAQFVERIGLALAILIPVILSYSWAKNAKKWVLVLWIISVAIVVVFYVLNIIL